MPDKPENEKILLQKIAENDEFSFSTIFDHYRPVIYTLALRYTGAAWLAEEVVQDTFLKVWLRRSTLPEIENFGGWLYTIAQGLTINAAKKAGREQLNLKEWAQQYNLPEAAPTVEETEYYGILKEAVDRLPQRQQQVYKLIKQEGLKRGEAAERLQVSEETIKSNLDHAMRSIRAWCIARMDRSSAVVIFLLIFRKYL